LTHALSLACDTCPRAALAVPCATSAALNSTPYAHPAANQAMPEHYFPGQFRFPKSDFPALIAAYNIPDVFNTGGSSRVLCNAWDGLGIFLRRLAFPCRYEDMELFFNVHRCSLKAIFRWLLKHILAQCRNRMQRLSRSFLTDDRLLQYCAALQSRGCRLRRVFATIDGALRVIYSFHALYILFTPVLLHVSNFPSFHYTRTLRSRHSVSALPPGRTYGTTAIRLLWLQEDARHEVAASLVPGRYNGAAFWTVLLCTP
jgi:hypothetical protein